MRIVDLFCGCGGFSLGFEKAGMKIVAAVDNWDAALQVYRDNFDHPAIRHDLTDETGVLDIIRNHAPDMIIGGPPCQDFSSAGKRDVNLGRADLTYHFANSVCAYKPKWFAMENVDRAIKSHIVKEISAQFIEHGYGLTAVILDASHCNTPQARTRFFLIGEMGGKHNALIKFFENNLSAKPMTVRDYLGDTLNLQHYYRHPRNYSRRGIFSVDEPSPTVRGVNRPIPAGYNLNGCNPPGVDLKTVRPLTTLERGLIQTFPATFKFNGTKTNLEQMIGNAVPVNLAQFVATCIKQYIDEGSAFTNKSSLFDFEDDFVLPDKPLHRSLTASRIY